MTGGQSPAPAGRGPAWLRANRPALRFIVAFLLWIGGFSILFQIPWIDDRVIVPMTELLARIAGLGLRGLGFEIQVSGTVLGGSEGFAVNILKGCNGAYVMAIFLAAVLAFPATWKERGIGILAGLPAVQGINLMRILSLYWIGVRHPDLFERFHYHVWQTLVILLSMALWVLWAEFLVRKPAR